MKTKKKKKEKTKSLYIKCKNPNKLSSSKMYIKSICTHLCAFSYIYVCIPVSENCMNIIFLETIHNLNKNIIFLQNTKCIEINWTNIPDPGSLLQWLSRGPSFKGLSSLHRGICKQLFGFPWRVCTLNVWLHRTEVPLLIHKLREEKKITFKRQKCH